MAQAIRQFGSSGKDVAVIFAAAASQIETLRALTGMPDLAWKQVLGFHMDSYVDLPEDHPASFIYFLRQHLTQHVTMKEFFGIDGNAPDPELACRDYAEKLRSAKPQLCLAGIGENGHLAFNDPPEADFNDPLDVKIVQLDDVTQQQQVAEGWFKSLEDVPKSAITLTVPALLRVQKIIASVPGSRKAEIIRRVVEEPIARIARRPFSGLTRMRRSIWTQTLLLNWMRVRWQTWLYNGWRSPALSCCSRGS